MDFVLRDPSTRRLRRRLGMTQRADSREKRGDPPQFLIFNFLIKKAGRRPKTAPSFFASEIVAVTAATAAVVLRIGPERVLLCVVIVEAVGRGRLTAATATVVPVAARGIRGIHAADKAVGKVVPAVLTAVVLTAAGAPEQVVQDACKAVVTGIAHKNIL